MSAVNDTSRAAQRQRLEARLKKGPADTLTLRLEENILAPAPRVKELRDSGYEILTTRITLTDERGRMHRGIALYSLIRLPRKGESA